MEPAGVPNARQGCALHIRFSLQVRSLPSFAKVSRCNPGEPCCHNIKEALHRGIFRLPQALEVLEAFFPLFSHQAKVF